MKQTFLISAALLGTIGIPCGIHAQSEEQREKILRVAGENAGSALLSTYEAVNTLSEGWTKNIFTDAAALELATSYRASAELTLNLIREQVGSGDSKALAEGAELLSKQATALEAWIRIGEPALGSTYEKLKLATDAALFGGGTVTSVPTPASGADAGVIRLKIGKTVNPDGTPGDPGKVTVTRFGEGVAMKVLWEYDDGTTESGFGVAIPGSGKMAVGFGTGVITVGLYERDGRLAEGFWISAKEGAQVRGIRMTQGASASEYEIEGGGSFSFRKGEANTGIPAWSFPNGKFTGIAVGEGDYLAVISCQPDAAAGVAYFSMSEDGKTAASRWTVIGVAGSGTEELAVTSVDVFPESDVPTVTAGVSVRRIAEELRENLGNVEALKPGVAEIEAICATSAAAEKLAEYVESVYAEIPREGSAAKEGQTEILVTGPAPGDLPGGYSRQAEHFKPGINFYGFKYVKPGETLGMSYDGLFEIGGKWFFIPKAWRAFAE